MSEADKNEVIKVKPPATLTFEDIISLGNISLESLKKITKLDEKTVLDFMGDVILAILKKYDMEGKKPSGILPKWFNKEDLPIIIITNSRHLFDSLKKKK